MVETLVNLKNNKLKDTKRATGTGQNVAAEAIERMKKYLSGINKKRHGKRMSHFHSSEALIPPTTSDVPRATTGNIGRPPFVVQAR